MDLAPDFDEFIGCLIVHGVDFVIVGAYALAFHGAPRFTGDLDILVRPTIENATRLLRALEAFGFPVSELSPEAVADRRRMLQMGVPPVQLHVMTAISGVEWHEVWADRIDGPLGRHTVSFLCSAASCPRPARVMMKKRTRRFVLADDAFSSRTMWRVSDSCTVSKPPSCVGPQHIRARVASQQVLAGSPVCHDRPGCSCRPRCGRAARPCGF